MRFVLLAMACVAVASSARAQEEAVRTIPFEGTEVFCHILNYEGLAAAGSFQELQQAPKRSLLVLFGDSRRWPKRILGKAELAQFVRDGGNLLIATDHRLSIQGVPVRISGEPERVASKEGYRGKALCPILNRADFHDHPIFNLLHRDIATNCPSKVQFDERHAMDPWHGDSIFLARYVDKENHRRGFMTEAIAGSRRDAPPAGRALFIAGHGLFMNGMMMQSDNDNFNFAINVVRWLREGPKGAKRTKALFIVDDMVITNFDVNLTPPPMVPMPPIKAMDRLLHGLEKERFFHRILDPLFRDNRSTFLSILFTAVTLLMLVYGAKKLMEGRYVLETAAPRMVGAAAALGPTMPVVEQRQRALFRQENLDHEAKLLARTWLRQEFGMEPEQGTLDSRMELRVNGWFWGCRSLQRQADRVLHLAVSADITPMTRRAFARLLRSLPKLGEARRRGRLALLADGKTVRLERFTFGLHTSEPDAQAREN